jgi:hypothetical protein
MGTMLLTSKVPNTGRRSDLINTFETDRRDGWVVSKVSRPVCRGSMHPHMSWEARSGRQTQGLMRA